MNRKQLTKEYKSACDKDNTESTEETKQARLNALAQLGRHCKRRIKQAKESQLNLFQP